MSGTPARRRASTRRRPARRGKAAIVLAQSIASEIHRRGLAAGDKLLSEQKMVERYGVARGSLREALRYLELQGVLRIKSGPGGGPLIQTPDGRHFASTLALMLQFVGARFRTIVETRWVVEPGIAALAAERATDDEVAALRACLAAMREALADSRRFAEENRRFHDLLAYASGNPLFRFLVPALHWISDGAGGDYSGEERRRILRGMADILAAIEARAPAVAYDLTRAFFGASLAYLDRAHGDLMARPLRWSDCQEER
ncbi:MAG TPA: FCD domain-containing protein [Candidatus Dormibacteraeota bacterium]|nr:FCD domain-containing protein [Candidatus Dormibacteraeota bacterium]